MADADTEFVERYRGLVERIARSVQVELHMRREVEDLVGFGMVGLLEARSRYDASRGVQFNTFAYYRIRGAILDGISKMAYLPRRAVRQARALSLLDAESEHAGTVRAQAGTSGDPKEAAIDALSMVLSRAATAYSLALMTPTTPDPEVDASNQQAIVAMRKATEALPEREQTLLRHHYMEEHSLDAIGKDLGLSKSWMSRLHAKALDQLRITLNGELPINEDERTG